MSKVIEHLEALKHDVMCINRMKESDDVIDEMLELIDSRISDIEHDEMIKDADKAWRER